MEMLKLVTAIALVKGLGNKSFEIESVKKQNEKSFVFGQLKSVKWLSD